MRKLFILILVISTVYGGYWFVGAAAVENGAKTWFADRSTEGWTAEYSDLSTRGFPSRFDTTVTDLNLVDRQSGLGWTAPFMQVFALSYQPNEIIAVWPHTQKISTAFETITVETEKMRASIGFAANSALTLDRSTAEIDMATLRSTLGWTITLDRSLLALRRSAEKQLSYDLYFEANALAPSAETRTMIDPNGTQPAAIDQIKLDTVIGFDAPWDRYINGSNRPTATDLRLKTAQLQWGEIALMASGEFDVDQQGRLDGDLSVTLTNWRQLIALARAAGAMDEQQANLALGLLGGLSDGAAPGTPLSIPIKIDQGQMRFSFVPLGPAPRLQF